MDRSCLASRAAPHLLHDRAFPFWVSDGGDLEYCPHALAVPARHCLPPPRFAHSVHEQQAAAVLGIAGHLLPHDQRSRVAVPYVDQDAGQVCGKAQVDNGVPQSGGAGEAAAYVRDNRF